MSAMCVLGCKSIFFPSSQLVNHEKDKQKSKYWTKLALNNSIGLALQNKSSNMRNFIGIEY
jgi:hypothetical protein